MLFEPTDSRVEKMGRMLTVDNVLYLNYSGAEVSFTMQGTKAEVTLISDGEKWEEHLKAWVAVFINDEAEPAKRFMLTKQRETFTIYQGVEDKEVQIRLVKYSEVAFAKVGIESFAIEGELLKRKEDTRLVNIEFIGDSITCGYGIEGEYNVDTFHTAQENPYTAYAMQVARNINARYHLVSWSGIGVISSWVGETEEKPLNDWLMPMLYQYTDAALSRDLELKEWDKWDFSQFVPDIIVIHLGTNDQSYTRKIAERVHTFGEEYYHFLKFVREHNQKAHILCVLGAMGQDLCPEIEKQVALFNEKEHDGKVYFRALELQKDEDGIAADWHPSQQTHNKMAAVITKEILPLLTK